MKKQLLILLFWVGFLNAQTYQNPTYGTVTSKTAPTNNTPATVTVQDATGVIGKTSGENIPVVVTPSVINYAPITNTLSGHLKGIDTKLGQGTTTSAGIFNRIWWTGETTVLSTGTYFLSNATGKGSVASASPATVSPDDNQKLYFSQDLIGNAFIAGTTFPAGSYSGQLSVLAAQANAQQRYTVEIYKTNINGTPISSGVSGAPVGSLGVTVVTILDSGLLNLVAGNNTNITVSGTLTGMLTINVNERIRYHVSAEKVGTTGNANTMSVFYGSNWSSYYDVPVTFTMQSVYNQSVQPQITTSATLGAVVVKRGSAADTDNILVGQNGAGSNTFVVKGDGLISSKKNYVGDGSYNTNPLTGDPQHIFDISSSSNTDYLFRMVNYSNTTGLANFHVQKARGTETTPLPVLTGDLLASFGFRGYGGSNGFQASSAVILAIAEENFSNTNKGTSLAFEVTPTGITLPSGRIRALKLNTNGLASMPYGIASSFVQNEKNGSDTEGNGAYYSLQNTGNSRQWINQLSASNDIFWSYYNGSTYSKKLTLKNSGDLEILGTVSASPATLPTQLATLGQVNAVVRPYKVYVALLSQSGTSTPTATVLENTLGGTVVWTRSSAGTYVGTLSGAFTANKTTVFSLSNGISTGSAGSVAYTPVTASTVTIITQTFAGVASDGYMNPAAIEIRVYP